MATENIVSKKYRILSDVANKVWDVISFFTLAKDVETTNGNNLETTCGSITGITSSLTSTSKTMAASASAIKELNDKITDLNSNLSSINESMTMGTSGTTTHTVTSGKYYLAFRIAKGSDLEGAPTFTGADNISELYRKVIFSTGNLHIYLIKATSDSVTSTKSVILLQLEK